MVFKVKSGIGKTAGWQAFHQSSCLCSWFHSQVLVNFNLKDRYFLLWLKIIPSSLPQILCTIWLHGSLLIEIQYPKAFCSNKVSSYLHTINTCGVCLITLVMRSAHNSMLHKRLKWNIKPKVNLWQVPHSYKVPYSM